MDYTVSKLILLFVLDKADIPMQEDTIIEMCSAKNDWVPYLECRPAFFQLIDVGFIMETGKNGSAPAYMITADGRMCLTHFYTKIPMSIRDDITVHIKNNLLSYRKRQEYFSDYYKNSDGTYTVNLKILAPGAPVMELKLNALNRHAAKWIYKNWEEKAPQIYEMLYDNLIE